MSVHYEVEGPIAVVTIARPEVRNAIDGPTAKRLAESFQNFESDKALSVAVLTGADDTFCSGAELKAVSSDKNNLSVDL